MQTTLALPFGCRDVLPLRLFLLDSLEVEAQ